MKKALGAILCCMTGFFPPVIAQLTMIWKNDTAFQGPESVVYDKQHNCLYVSNFIGNPKNGDNYNEYCISKADIDGTLTEKQFVGNLTSPTGLCINNGKLYIVERFGVVQFDLETKRVETRYRLTGPGFLNDVAVDSSGHIYVTVSDREMIYKISNRSVEKWIESPEMAGINGIIADGNKIIVGITGDSCLKSIRLDDKKIDVIARFPAGIIDGIKKYGDDYLVSHFEGNIYLVKKDGTVIELLNTRGQNMHCADFEFIEEKNLLIIPALWHNSVVAYQYNPM